MRAAADGVKTSAIEDSQPSIRAVSRAPDDKIPLAEDSQPSLRDGSRQVPDGDTSACEDSQPSELKKLSELDPDRIGEGDAGFSARIRPLDGRPKAELDALNEDSELSPIAVEEKEALSESPGLGVLVFPTGDRIPDGRTPDGEDSQPSLSGGSRPLETENATDFGGSGSDYESNRQATARGWSRDARARAAPREEGSEYEDSGEVAGAAEENSELASARVPVPHSASCSVGSDRASSGSRAATVTYVRSPPPVIPNTDSAATPRECEQRGLRRTRGVRRIPEPRAAGGSKLPVKNEPLSRRGSTDHTLKQRRRSSRDRAAPVAKEKKSATREHRVKSTRDSHGGGGVPTTTEIRGVGNATVGRQGGPGLAERTPLLQTRALRDTPDDSEPSDDDDPGSSGEDDDLPFEMTTRTDPAAIPDHNSVCPSAEVRVILVFVLLTEKRIRMAAQRIQAVASSESESESDDDTSGSSYSSESESEHDDQELHEKEIDEKRQGVFLITRDTIRKAKKNKPKYDMPCEVDDFARGSDINIIEWIVEMEVYFIVSNLKPNAYVGFMLQKISHPYFKEVVDYKEMAYFDFREKLIEVFGVPDFATSRLLKEAEQQYGETIGDFMNRLRLLVMRAHSDLGYKERERILISSFILGLRDQKLSTSLSMASVSSSAEAERRATEGESAKRNARNKELNSNCLPKHAEVPNETAEGSELVQAISATTTQIHSAAFGVQRGGRGGATGGRPSQRSRTRMDGREVTTRSKCLQLRRSWAHPSGVYASARSDNVFEIQSRSAGMPDVPWTARRETLPEVRSPSASTRFGRLRNLEGICSKYSSGRASIELNAAAVGVVYVFSSVSAIEYSAELFVLLRRRFV